MFTNLSLACCSTSNRWIHLLRGICIFLLSLSSDTILPLFSSLCLLPIGVCAFLSSSKSQINSFHKWWLFAHIEADLSFVVIHIMPECPFPVFIYIDSIAMSLQIPFYNPFWRWTTCSPFMNLFMRETGRLSIISRTRYSPEQVYMR